MYKIFPFSDIEMRVEYMRRDNGINLMGCGSGEENEIRIIKISILVSLKIVEKI